MSPTVIVGVVLVSTFIGLGLLIWLSITSEKRDQRTKISARYMDLVM
jgi:hypothetical protein